MGRYIHVARINRGPGVLEHKYHRHRNHGGPRVGFCGYFVVPVYWTPFLGGVSAGGLYRPPPPPPPETKTRHPLQDFCRPFPHPMLLICSLFTPILTVPEPFPEHIDMGGGGLL